MRVFPSLHLGAVLMLAIAGCGGQEEAGHESAEAEVCEHMDKGPARAVSASSDPAQAPTVAADHHRYDISIPDAFGRTGYVSFVSDEAGEVAIYVSTEAGLVVLDASNTEVPIEKTAGGESCDQIKVVHHVMLQVGTYSLRLTSDAASTVAMVIEREHDAHEHEHEH